METQVEFRGRKEERTLAQWIFNLMMRQASMYALDTPVRQSLNNLTDYFFERELRQRRENVAAFIERALAKNEEVFAREERDGDVFYVTTKRGYLVEVEPEPPLPPRHLHESPKGATPTPRRRVRRRPPMAPFWVRASVRQMQPVRPAVAEVTPPQPVISTVEEVAVAAVARKEAFVTELTLRDGTVIDFGREVEAILAEHNEVISAHLFEALERDFRLVSFGDQWYHEDQLEHLSKGRLNEIRRYIQEEEVPLTDETILGDLFFKSPRDPDYDLWAFSLNARLLRERKDFEFVGVRGANLWAVKGLPSIGTRLLKASEIGQDYSFLLEEEEAAEAPPQLEHFLTYYEYQFGVLPYDGLARAFFPSQMLEGQRTAQLRFEMPQHYEAYPVELRFPSGNRGGWLWGLEEFFHSSLVPGALIIITPTDEANVFILQYMATEAQEHPLLVYDERRRRYTFDEITFYCAVEDSFLLSEERFPRLHKSKPLPPSRRKRPADAVAHAFTLIGEEQKGQYRASLDDLLPVVNIERPFSVNYLLQVLDEVDVFDSAGEEGWYVYSPDEDS